MTWATSPPWPCADCGNDIRRDADHEPGCSGRHITGEPVICESCWSSIAAYWTRMPDGPARMCPSCFEKFARRLGNSQVDNVGRPMVE